MNHSRSGELICQNGLNLEIFNFRDKTSDEWKLFLHKQKEEKKKEKKEKTNVLIMLAVLRSIKRKENHSFFPNYAKLF